MLKGLLSAIGAYKLYERWLWNQIKNEKMPEHIAIILDGNRRWASGRLYESWIGHKYGAKKTESLLKWCLDLGVKSVTLYAFSTENFQRPKKEIDEIFSIAEERLKEVLTQEFIHEYSVNVKVIGRLDSLPEE